MRPFLPVSVSMVIESVTKIMACGAPLMGYTHWCCSSPDCCHTKKVCFRYKSRFCPHYGVKAGVQWIQYLLQPELRATMRFADLSLILLTDFISRLLFRFIRSRSYLSLSSLGPPEQPFSIHPFVKSSLFIGISGLIWSDTDVVPDILTVMGSYRPYCSCQLVCHGDDSHTG